MLGEDHLCFFVHAVIERLDLSEFEQAYSEEGGAVYAPALMLKVWLYGYALGITSARRLEQRIREDLAFRYLAGGDTPDNWALSAFRRRHARALNDVFTQVLELARRLGWARLGHVAIDSSRVAASASRDRVDREDRLRARLRRLVRRWQRACDATIQTSRLDSRRRSSGSINSWLKFRGAWSDCARAGRNNCRAPIRTAVFCGSGAGSPWATRPKWQ